MPVGFKLNFKFSDDKVNPSCKLELLVSNRFKWLKSGFADIWTFDKCDIACNIAS